MTTREAILQMIKENVSVKGLRLGNVVSVNDSTRTCVVNVLDSETDIEDVRLHVTGGGTINGLYYKPAVGSFVGIYPLFAFEYCVLLYSYIDEITFLDGSYGGVVKVADLVTKINALENQVNSILTTLKSTSIPLAPSGTYPFASLYASLSNLNTTTAADLENTKVKHGTV